MKIQLFWVLVILVMLPFSACKKADMDQNKSQEDIECGAQSGRINIRIENDSPYNFCCVILNPSDGESEFGTILRGETSCYRPFNTAYRFAYIQLSIASDDFVWEPISYDGEVALSPGTYTYVVNVVDYTTQELSLQLK